MLFEGSKADIEDYSEPSVSALQSARSYSRGLTQHNSWQTAGPGTIRIRLNYLKKE